MFILKYGNTNTFFISGKNGNLLVDTDYAGTLPAFYKALKTHDIKVNDITYVIATHYHPDHIGLISELCEQGVGHLIIDVQKDSVHFSDRIFERDKLPYKPIKETEATVISCAESRGFLSEIGISGEIIRTPSHSTDSVSIILDDGSCIIGDTEPCGYTEIYEDNSSLRNDWSNILSYNPKRIFSAHRPAFDIDEWE